MGIEEIRKEIDALDEAIAERVARRLEIMKKVAEFKIEHGLPILDAQREQAVLAKNALRFPPKLYAYGERFFHSLMGLCKDYQFEFFPKSESSTLKGRAGFQGVEGSFSHEALEAYFGAGTKALSYILFEDAAKALEAGEIQYAVLPIENSSTGAINEVYDLLLKYKLFIVGEKIIPIRHNLLGVEGSSLESVQKVYSHIQGLRQSAPFLQIHPQFTPIEATNTAAAARMVAESKDISLAAIASQRAGQIYGLKVLAANIQSSNANSTRFIIVSRRAEEGPADKVSTSFMLAHRPGALHAVLKVLSEYKLNMCKLESRPMPERPWEYIFYLDFDFSPSAQNTQETLKKLEETCSSFVMLGAYKADKG